MARSVESCVVAPRGAFQVGPVSTSYFSRVHASHSPHSDFACCLTVITLPGRTPCTRMGWADICTWSTKRLSRVEATPSLSRRRAVRRAALAWASGLLLGFVLACQATIWLEPATPELAVVEQLALQLSASAMLSAMLALLLRRWLRLAASLALAATLAAPTVNQAIDAGGAPGLSGAT
ncbi:MAG: hypothetical protein JNN33_15100, partial [Rhodospirillaceae bacterium]|nr:hypothetical protein [Rhodospirillaceae bacterium]